MFCSFWNGVPVAGVVALKSSNSGWASFAAMEVDEVIWGTIGVTVTVSGRFSGITDGDEETGSVIRCGMSNFAGGGIAWNKKDCYFVLTKAGSFTRLPGFG